MLVYQKVYDVFLSETTITPQNVNWGKIRLQRLDMFGCRNTGIWWMYRGAFWTVSVAIFRNVRILIVPILIVSVPILIVSVPIFYSCTMLYFCSNICVSLFWVMGVPPILIHSRLFFFTLKEPTMGVAPLMETSICLCWKGDFFRSQMWEIFLIGWSHVSISQFRLPSRNLA